MKKLRIYIVIGILLMPLATICYLSIVSTWTFPQLMNANFNLKLWTLLFKAENSLFFNFSISLLIAIILSISGTFIGYLVSKELLLKKPDGKWLQFAYYPYLIAPVVFGGMLQFYFVKWGLTGTFMGVMIAQALFIYPFSILLFSTFWNEKTRLTAFQAITIGASERQVNYQILIPMAKPWFILSLIQCFLISWFEYGITRLVGVGKIETLTVKTMFFLKEASPHQASIASLLMILPVIILFLMATRLISKKNPI